ncbi:MAG: class I SAM-dependent methyltransferase [Candidatus Aenigmatarchaeota archaeon]
MKIVYAEENEFQSINCTLCGDTHAKKKILNIHSGDKIFDLFLCDNCKAYFYHPFEPPKYDSKGENEESRISLFRYNVEFATDYFLTIFPLMVIENYLKDLKKKEGKIKFLDVGSGVGIGLLYAKYYFDFESFGIEPAKYGKLVEHFLNVPIFSGYLEDFTSNERFHIITCMQVIEHIKDPVRFLKKLKDLLKENGILIMTTPHSERVYFEHGIALPTLSPGQHVIIYNETSMAYLLEQAGFRNYKILRDIGGDLLIFAFNDSSQDGNILEKDIFNSLFASKKFIEISESILSNLEKKISNPFYVGLLYRLFKYHIGLGNYIKAFSLIFDVRYEILLDPKKLSMVNNLNNINTLEEWGMFFIYSYHCFLYYYAMLKLNFFSNIPEAIQYFSISSKLCEAWLIKGFSADIESKEIYYRSVFHEAYALYRNGEYDKAYEKLRHFISFSSNEPSYIKLKPPQDLIFRAEELIKNIRNL